MSKFGQTDDRQKVITIAHPEHSSGELKIKYFIKVNLIPYYAMTVLGIQPLLTFTCTSMPNDKCTMKFYNFQRLVLTDSCWPFNFSFCWWRFILSAQGDMIRWLTKTAAQEWFIGLCHHSQRVCLITRRPSIVRHIKISQTKANTASKAESV